MCQEFGYLPDQVDAMDPDHFASLMAGGEACRGAEQEREADGLFVPSAGEDCGVLWDRAMEWRRRHGLKVADG